MAPKRRATIPNNYENGERIGNVSRDVAEVLSLLMDGTLDYLLECSTYGLGFQLKCVLCDDSNHKSDGFGIHIVVYSINSDIFTDQLIIFFQSKGIQSKKII